MAKGYSARRGFSNGSGQMLKQQQMQQQAAAKAQQEAAKGVWKCSCGTENTGNFCSNCGLSLIHI